MRGICAVSVLLILVARAVPGQTPAPAFEIASIKPVSATSQEPLDFRLQAGGRLTITNLTLKTVILQAFDIKKYQLESGPSWLDNERFDIIAKATGDPARKQMLEMLQTLLADRFQLKTHREMRQGDVFTLVLGKHGHRLTQSTADKSYIRLYRNTPTDQVGVDYTISGQKATMAMLAEALGDMQLQRPVLDRTGIHGEFDFKLRYAINDDPDTGASIFVAIQEQLGLTLRAAKGPVEMLVIDGVEKPSVN